MSTKEIIAIGLSCAAAGGSLAAANQFKTMADARARAITAQACELFDVNGAITKQTLDCLKSPYVAEGETVDTSNMSAGDAEGLIQGYAKIESSRGNNFDARGTLIAGFSLGMMAAAAAMFIDAKEERKEYEEAEFKDPSLKSA